MAKKKKGSSGAGKGNLGTAKAGSAVYSAQGYAGNLRDNAISREEFLKIAGLGAGAVAAAGIGFGGIAKAQTPPPAYDVQTLAALVDTIIPGLDTPKDIYFIVPNPSPPPATITIPYGTMTNLGTSSTTTPGAADPLLGGNLPPHYQYLYTVLPLMARDPDIISTVVEMLDSFADAIFPGSKFKDLYYGQRKYILDMIDSQPPGIIKTGVRLVLFLTHMLWHSEYCNLIPSGYDSAGPKYERIYVGGQWVWPVIPDGAWSQMGYPGPLYSMREFQSPYFDVRIKSGKVVFY